MLTLLALALTLQTSPVEWSFSAPEPKTAIRAGALFRAKVEADIAEGWHLYSLKPVAGGPIPTTLKVDETSIVRRHGAIEAPPALRRHDAAFGVEVESYENMVEFTIPLEVAKEAPPGPAIVVVEARFQACDGKQCLPPRTVRLELPLVVR